MTTKPDPQVAHMEGAEALPRKNGELVFEALWEGRVFGMAVGLNDQGVYPWRDFRDQLVAEVATDDSSGTPSSYYERFLKAFEKLVIAKGLVDPEELDARTQELAMTQGDEDHDHNHS